MGDAALVLTDSGGIQEETTVLGVPVLTLRESTERPVTVTSGTNCVVGTDTELIVEEALVTLEGTGRPLRFLSCGTAGQVSESSTAWSPEPKCGICRFARDGVVTQMPEMRRER